MTRGAALVVLLALACSSCLAQPLPVRSAHRLPVTALAASSAGDLLFSVAEDGLLAVWDLATGAAVARLQLSPLPLRALAVHPALPHVAVVESDLGATRLEAWDWRAARRLWALELDMPPSSVRYSSTGKWLVVSRERYDSLLFLDPATGGRLPFFVEGFGIVSFVTFNSDDLVMMSYQANGEVRYWDMASQEQRLRTIATEPFLRTVALSGSWDSPKDSLVGSTGRQLVVADIVRSGAVRERVALPDVIAVAASGRGEIASLSREVGGVRFTRWLQGAQGTLLLASSRLLGQAEGWPGGAPLVLCMDGSSLYAGCDDGSIVELPSYGEPRLFARRQLAAVSDVAVSGGELLAAVPGGVVRIALPASLSRLAGAAVEPRIEPVPLAGALRLAVSPDGEVWAWGQEQGSGELARVLPGSVRGAEAGLLFPSGIANAGWSGDELCVVERSGRCSILARSAWSTGYFPVFEFFAPGANAMVSSSRAVLIGRSTHQRGDSPLLLIDRLTGETAPLAGGEELVYELAWEPDTDSVLSLGVSRSPTVRSSLVRRGGAQYLERQTLVEYQGEDTAGDLAGGGDSLYTSVGFALARAGSPEAARGPVLRVPRRIALAADMLVSLNLDGSITLWGREDLLPVADLHLFADGEWVVSAGGRVEAASSGASRYLDVPHP